MSIKWGKAGPMHADTQTQDGRIKLSDLGEMPEVHAQVLAGKTKTRATAVNSSKQSGTANIYRRK